ncbi:MAG: hypothetical protein K0R06_357 [Clostridium sp.]|jgi:hypothetical protein|nr:hypothetical protein [Clostridium sp.]
MILKFIDDFFYIFNKTLYFSIMKVHVLFNIVILKVIRNILNVYF